MSGEQLNLDAIEARAAASASLVGFNSIHGAVSREDVPALVAEVRRLRDERADVAREAVAIAATVVLSGGETDPDIADSTLRHLSRRTKALADRLRE